jgi:hypothetical protein
MPLCGRTVGTYSGELGCDGWAPKARRCKTIRDERAFNFSHGSDVWAERRGQVKGSASVRAAQAQFQPTGNLSNGQWSLDGVWAGRSLGHLSTQVSALDICPLCRRFGHLSVVSGHLSVVSPFRVAQTFGKPGFAFGHLSVVRIAQTFGKPGFGVRHLSKQVSPSDICPSCPSCRSDICPRRFRRCTFVRRVHRVGHLSGVSGVSGVRIAQTFGKAGFAFRHLSKLVSPLDICPACPLCLTFVRRVAIPCR